MKSEGWDSNPLTHWDRIYSPAPLSNSTALRKMNSNFWFKLAPSTTHGGPRYRFQISSLLLTNLLYSHGYDEVFFRVGYNTKTSFVQSSGVYEHSFLATMRLDFLPIEMHQ